MHIKTTCALIRSHDNLEGGTSRHPPRKLPAEFDGTNSVAENFQREQPSSVVVEVPWMRGTTVAVAKRWSQMKKNLSPKGSSGTLILVLSCLSVILLDPLFFYIPVLNDVRKCIGYDKTLGMVASTLRTISDILYVMYIIIPLWKRLRSDSRKLMWILHLLYIMTFLPLPQVHVLLIFAGKLKGYGIVYAAVVILGQHITRLFVMLKLLLSTKNSGRLVGCARYAFYLCFFYFGHAIGALWYLFALLDETECWRTTCFYQNACRTKACQEYKECSKFNCDASLRDYSQLPSYSCSTAAQNPADDSFRLYKDAVSYGIVHFSVGDSPRKILFCLRWGFQSLSSFGQNLQTSDDALENLFVLLISVLSIVLFVFLIAEMQIYLQSEAARSEKRKVKVVALNKWKPFKKLSRKIQWEVEEYLQCQETEHVNVENLFNDISSHLKRSIKHQLCIEMLKKVEEFGKWSDDLLYHICDYVKPVFYTEDTYIVRERDPVDQMFFVLQGRLLMDSSSGSAHGLRVLENGEFCGEELVAWFQADPYSYNLPISAATVRTVTRVEGFALMSDDLKRVLIMHHKALIIQSHWRTKMMLRFTRNVQTSTSEANVTNNAVLAATRAFEISSIHNP
ncbi:hypothetical protein ACOSQ2_027909 [Xanthoceras sorbifolium]